VTRKRLQAKAVGYLDFVSPRASLIEKPFSSKQSLLTSIAHFLVDLVYCPGMTQQLQEAIDRLQELPEEAQDSVARTIIHTLDVEQDCGEHDEV
jgi:hypothetical protein